MRIYTALLRSGAEPILVKEGFAWGAFLFGPIWFAAHRAWIAAAISVAACGLVAVLAPRPVSDVLLLALGCMFGVIGNDLRRWALEHRGYHVQHVVAAAGEEAALGRLLTYRPDLNARFRPEPT